MGELANGLIQMNAHMVRTSASRGMMIFGLFAALVLFFAAALSHSECGWKFSGVLVFLGIACAVLFIVGLNTPRVKEIRMCANGPISLEAIAARYEIVSVDGAEITVREK